MLMLIILHPEFMAKKVWYEYSYFWHNLQYQFSSLQTLISRIDIVLN